MQVSSFNAIGYGNPSPQNSDGIQVQIEPPNMPADLIVNLDDTNEHQISLQMTAFAFISETGGAEIISYSLEWDGGNEGNTFEALVGLDSNNI